MAMSGTLTFGIVTPHDAIVVAVDFTNGGTALASVTDTLQNTYVPVVGPVLANGVECYILLAQNTLGGPNTITVTLSPAPSQNTFEAYAVEYAGLATSNTLDQTGWAVGMSKAVDGMATAAKMTTSPHELIFGYGLTGIAVAGTGFKLESNLDGNVIEDKEITSVGSYQATATMTSGMTWAMLMATFRGQ